MFIKIYLLSFGIACISIETLLCMQGQLDQKDRAMQVCDIILAQAASAHTIEECLTLSQSSAGRANRAEMKQALEFLRKKLKECELSLATLQSGNLHEILGVCYPINTDELAQKFLRGNAGEALKLLNSSIREGIDGHCDDDGFFQPKYQKETYDFFYRLQKDFELNRPVGRVPQLKLEESERLLNFLKLRKLLMMQYQIYANLQERRLNDKISTFVTIRNNLLIATTLILIGLALYNRNDYVLIPLCMAAGIVAYITNSPIKNIAAFRQLFNKKIAFDLADIAILEAYVKERRRC